MSLTAFPNGVSSFGIPVLGGGPDPIVGSVYFVDSATGSNSNLGNAPSKAFATLDYAIGKCTASKGDTIYVMPDHAETITGVGGITADVAGITIVGLGKYNQRPRFLMDGATTVTFVVSAADVTVKNLVFASGHADVVTCFNVTGKGCTIEGCEFVENIVDENFVTAIKATGAANTADGLRVIGCRYLQVDASTAEFIEFTDNADGVVISNNFVCATAGTAVVIFLCAGTKVLTNLLCTWNFLQSGNTANDLAYDNGGSANTGIIAHNRIGHLDVTAGHVLGAVAGCQFFDNLSVSTSAASGFVLPAIDADS
jgi:hypothetical protein